MLKDSNKYFNLYGRIKASYNKHFAFTMAEIMITIGIVGVVAAITIPLLIQNSNYKKFTTQFKKSLSTLNQAAISAQAQYDMDYALLSTSSSPSTCASDSMAGGQSTMCALFNNTLAGKTYLGEYGEVKGSIFLSKYKFTKTTEGFDPTKFLLYSLSDGTLVGFNPEAKRCSLENGKVINKDILTASNGLANCIGFIDVNGVTSPNREVTCSDGTSALEPNNPCKLKSNGFGLGDVFPIVFHNGTVEPATNASKAFFSTGSSGVGDDMVQIGTDSSGEPIYITREEYERRQKEEAERQEKLAKRRDFSKWKVEQVTTPMSKADCESKKESLGIEACNYEKDYFAAAAEKCGGVQNLPTDAELYELAKTIYGESNCSNSIPYYTLGDRCVGDADLSKLHESFLGLDSSSYKLWSSNESRNSHAWYWKFDSSGSSIKSFGHPVGSRGDSSVRVICVGDLK